MNHYWKLSETHPETPLTKAGVVNADAFWERITYFLDRIIPVANEYKVRMACHPQDPGVPPEGYQGINRVLGTIDGLKKFLTIRESPYHGLNFCQGTVSEAPPESARRNLRCHPLLRHSQENLQRALPQHSRPSRRFRRSVSRRRRHRFCARDQSLQGDRLSTYMLMPDHVPLAQNDPDSLQSFAFCYGYIRGLIQSVKAEA